MASRREVREYTLQNGTNYKSREVRCYATTSAWKSSSPLLKMWQCPLPLLYPPPPPQ